MTKAEDEDVVIDAFGQIGDNYEIVATEGGLVRITLTGETIISHILFYPKEAERMAKGMLKAAEHIKARLTPKSD